MAGQIQDILQKGEGYRVLARRKARGHYLASKSQQKMHTLLGVPVVAISAALGTSIFASLSSDPNIYVRISAGLLAILVTVLASLQTFFKYSESAEKNRVTAAEYAVVHRRLDIFLLCDSKSDVSDRVGTLKELEAIVTELNRLEKDAPDIPDHLYDQARREQMSHTGDSHN